MTGRGEGSLPFGFVPWGVHVDLGSSWSIGTITMRRGFPHQAAIRVARDLQLEAGLAQILRSEDWLNRGQRHSARMPRMTYILANAS
jgi:hypothetical protein